MLFQAKPILEPVLEQSFVILKHREKQGKIPFRALSCMRVYRWLFLAMIAAREAEEQKKNAAKEADGHAAKRHKKAIPDPEIDAPQLEAAYDTLGKLWPRHSLVASDSLPPVSPNSKGPVSMEDEDSDKNIAKEMLEAQTFQIEWITSLLSRGFVNNF